MKKHELNAGFRWQMRPGPYRLLSPVQAAQYSSEGFIVFDNVFDDATVDALLDELDPMEQATTQLLYEKFNGKAFIARAQEITFSPHPVLGSPLARAFSRAQFFRDLTHDLLGPDVRLYWDQLVYKKPGNPEVFPWHQDNGYTFVRPQHYLTCWVALSDANEDNGCPWVIPGAHRAGTYQHHMTELGWKCTDEEPETRTSAPVRKGGVVVFSSLTPHMTGANLTDQVRKAYIVQFAPDGARAITMDGDEQIETLCDAPDRQYLVMADGRAVEP